MKLLFKYISSAILFSLLISFNSCKEDNIFEENNRDRNSELLINFEFEIEDIATRGITNPKRSFEVGDVIHINGYFYDKEGNVIKESYNAYQYSASKTWTALSDALRWPNESYSGRFIAYHVPQSNFLLKSETETLVISLSELSGSEDQSDKDPLKGDTGKIQYGHNVNIKFYHACAYLQIEEVDAGLSDILLFTRKGSDGKYLSDFNNAFQLKLDSDNILSLEFLQQKDSDFNEEVYISSKSESYPDGSGQKCFVGFFLPPGVYNSFILGYPTSNSMEDYLTYNKPVSSEISENNLKENGFYTFNIYQSLGVVIANESTPQTWDETTDPVEVDVEEFLWCVANGLALENSEGTKILEQTPSGTKLCCNVDFKYQEYTIFPPDDKYHPDEDFEPNLDEAKTFDGNLHYIHNLASPLFRYNDGTITNLGIRYVKANLISYEENPGYDMSRLGIFCDWNRKEINNIRLQDKIEINVSINSSSSQETHNVGLITGSNSGSINQVEFAGDFEIILQNHDNATSIPAINVGGFIGQNIRTLTSANQISGKSSSIRIINRCKGVRGTYSIGGILGINNGGNIENIVLGNFTIDSRNSEGIISNIGGVAGLMENTSGTSISGCTLVGDIYAGKCIPDGTLSAIVYTGGIVGEFYNAGSVTNCRSLVNVNGTEQSNYVSQGVTYGTGGVFGRIANSNSSAGELFDIIASGNTIDGPAISIGNFAGLVPPGETWEKNYASKMISVKQIVTNNIGGNR